MLLKSHSNQKYPMWTHSSHRATWPMVMPRIILEFKAKKRLQAASQFLIAPSTQVIYVIIPKISGTINFVILRLRSGNLIQLETRDIISQLGHSNN